EFVLTDFHIHRQYRQTPFVFGIAVEINTVVVVRQHFAKGGHTDSPWTWLSQGIFQIRAYTHFGYIAAPILAAGGTLVTKTAQVVALLIAQVAEAWNIETRRATAVVVLVFVAFNGAARANAEMMVHYVVAQFTAAAAQAAFPDIGGGIHQNPGGVKAGGVEEHHIGGEFIGLVGFGVDHLNTAGALF